MIATRREPSQPGIQLEIGQGLVLAGFPIEAGPWIVAGATQLLELGPIDRAPVALRPTLGGGGPSCRRVRLGLVKGSLSMGAGRVRVVAVGPCHEGRVDGVIESLLGV